MHVKIQNLIELINVKIIQISNPSATSAAPFHLQRRTHYQELEGLLETLPNQSNGSADSDTTCL